MKITGVIRTMHGLPECVAAAIAADNLKEMETRAETGENGGFVVTTITSSRIRSVIASVDDYLANITVAEELCSKIPAISGRGTDRSDQDDNVTTQE
jgi:hypothetical protein